MVVERLLHGAAHDLADRHAWVHVRERPEPLVAISVDDCLQLVAAVAERAHPVSRRRGIRHEVARDVAHVIQLQ